MYNELTSIVERDGKWFVAHRPEIPGADGQGKTKAECLKSLSEAIEAVPRHYAICDLAGNVTEWSNDFGGEGIPSNRRYRGGVWQDEFPVPNLSAGWLETAACSLGGDFRVVSIHP